MKRIININLPKDNDGNGEELKKLYDVLYFRTENPAKGSKSKLYLTADDIERLNDRYSVLFRKVKTDEHLPEPQINKECAYLSEKYDFEIIKLSELREAEYLEQQAKIKAKNVWRTPRRRCWLWALLFQPLTNRAQDIIEQQAALDAEEHFAPLEKELDDRSDKLFGADVQKLSERKRKKIRKKYLKLKRKLEAALQAADEAEPADVIEQPEPPAAVESTPGTAAQTTPENGSAAHGASDAAHQSGDDNVTEPPEPPARKPRKAKQTGA